MLKKKIAIVILTFNSEAVIKKTILAAKKISKYIVICDSFSNDKTIKIARSLNCKIFYKKFTTYAKSRNYIIKKCDKLYEWQLHLDSDEILSNKLIKNINRVINLDDKNYSYLVKRRPYFLNKELLFGGSSNWHLRLFPSGTTLVENSNYDQHYKSKLSTKNISGTLHDLNIKNLNDWITTHNKWSELETTNNSNKNLVQPNFFGNNIERLRFFKSLYNLTPTLIRAFILFIYKYFILLGFLDGKIGFYYCFFNSLWFRTLIDAKKYEKSLIMDNITLKKILKSSF